MARSEVSPHLPQSRELYRHSPNFFSESGPSTRFSNEAKRTKRKSKLQQVKHAFESAHDLVVLGGEIFKAGRKISKRFKENHPHVQRLYDYAKYIDEAEKSPLAAPIRLSKQRLENPEIGLRIDAFGASMLLQNTQSENRQWGGLVGSPEVWNDKDTIPDLLAKGFQKAGFTNTEIHNHAVPGDSTSRTYERFTDTIPAMAASQKDILELNFWNINDVRQSADDLISAAKIIYMPHFAPNRREIKDFVGKYAIIIEEYKNQRLKGLEKDQQLYEQKKLQGRNMISVDLAQTHFQFHNPLMEVWSLAKGSDGDKRVAGALNTRALRRIGESVFGAENLGKMNAQEAFIDSHPDADKRVPVFLIPGNKIGKIEGKSWRQRREAKRAARKVVDGSFHLSKEGHRAYAEQIFQQIEIYDEVTGQTETLAEVINRNATKQDVSQPSILSEAA